MVCVTRSYVEWCNCKLANGTKTKLKKVLCECLAKQRLQHVKKLFCSFYMSKEETYDELLQALFSVVLSFCLK